MPNDVIRSTLFKNSKQQEDQQNDAPVLKVKGNMPAAASNVFSEFRVSCYSSLFMSLQGGLLLCVSASRCESTGWPAHCLWAAVLRQCLVRALSGLSGELVLLQSFHPGVAVM